MGLLVSDQPVPVGVVTGTGGEPAAPSDQLGVAAVGARPAPFVVVVDLAHILETGTESCRLRTSKTSTRRKRAS